MVLKKDLEILREKIAILQDEKLVVMSLDEMEMKRKELSDLRYEYTKLFKRYEIEQKNTKIGDFI